MIKKEPNNKNPKTDNEETRTIHTPSDDEKAKLDQRKKDEAILNDIKEEQKFRKQTKESIEKLLDVNEDKQKKNNESYDKFQEQLNKVNSKIDNSKKQHNLGNFLAGDVTLTNIIAKKLRKKILKSNSYNNGKGKKIAQGTIGAYKKVSKVVNAVSEKGLIRGVATLIRDKKIDAKYGASVEKLNKNIYDNRKANSQLELDEKGLNEIKKLINDPDNPMTKELSNISDALNDYVINNPYQKEVTEQTEEIAKALKKITKDLSYISENMVDEQDTSVTQAVYDKKEHNWTAPEQKVYKKKPIPINNNDNSNDSDSDTDVDVDYDRDKKKTKRQRRISRLKKAKLAKFATGGALGGVVGGVAMGASAMYIGDSLMDNYDQYQMADTEAERDNAVGKSVGGVSGAVTGGIIGAKALGTSGFIGGTVVPGIGNVAGLVGGAVTGAAAGGALGYYMGEKVGDYITSMWSGPLEKIPDSKRDNPFTIHEYLTNVLIPELSKSLEMEQDPDKRKDIEKGIGEYTELANKILTPDSLKKWMESKLKDNKLSASSQSAKQNYLNELMSQFKYNENYYNAGTAVIGSLSSAEIGTIDTVSNKLNDFIYGKKASEEADKKNLENATTLSKFNSSNTLGKDGKSLELSMNSSKNFDELVKNNIISDDWGNNSIKDISKLKMLPLSVLEDLKDNGDLDDKALKDIDKAIKDKRKEESDKKNDTKKEEKKEDKKVEKSEKIKEKTTALTSLTGIDNTSNTGMINDTDSNARDTEDIEKLAEMSYDAEKELIDFLNNNPYDESNSIDSEVSIDGIPQNVKIFKDGALNKKLSDLREKVLESRRNYNDTKMVVLSKSNDPAFLAQHGIYGSKQGASSGVAGDNSGPRISDDEFYYKQMAKDLENANKKSGNYNRTLSGSGSGASGSSGFNGGEGSGFETDALGQSSVADKSLPTSYEGLGGMSAQFESGGRGSSAVGWDSTGGTSYGKYQIATKTGTMRRFMDFLKGNNPIAYDELSKAGPADSGKNGQFAQTWKRLAKEGVLGNSEHEFIKATHYDVGVSGIKNKNLKTMLGSSKALQEVMWSTSVQHGGGGASSIFNSVYADGISEQDLIKAIYAKRSTKFGSSTDAVRASVMNRFKNEQKLAMNVSTNQQSGADNSNVASGQTGGVGSKEQTITNSSVTPKIPANNEAMVNKTGTKEAPISVDNNTKTMAEQTKPLPQAQGGNNVAVINSGGGSSNGGNTVSNSSFSQKTPDPTLMYAALSR